MHIISKKMLREFWVKHPLAEGPCKAWCAEVEDAEWDTPAELKERYPNASIIDDTRVVFNLGGNKYRLVVWVNYWGKRVFTRWVGTHKDYDKLNVGEL